MFDQLNFQLTSKTWLCICQSFHRPNCYQYNLKPLNLKNTWAYDFQTWYINYSCHGQGMTPIDFWGHQVKVKITLNLICLMGLNLEMVTKPFPINNLRIPGLRNFNLGIEIVLDQQMTPINYGFTRAKVKVMLHFVWKK